MTGQSQLPSHRWSPTQNSLDAPPPLEIRLFRLPSYLTNPKLLELISVFPNFIKVRIKSIKFNPLSILKSSSSINKDQHEKHSESSSPSRKMGSSGQLNLLGRSAAPSSKKTSEGKARSSNGSKSSSLDSSSFRTPSPQ
ncbi:hypothetical protein PGTUg99_028100 [Puccinia graminis f. sp. tritici]|uniref:Uncharacterized protein n=1 Tax=Puccinia graminis f. sp. tritici TaxID=56615 RepID=A0A5B0QLB5_PUCGR|nr:hypothetical protein PGTUg99_028100 [Puccinia graminis f. sp. tritici]